MKTIAIAVLLLLVLPLAAQAARRGQWSDGQGHVVHSRRAPVVMHRIMPPFKGIHVYQGR
ncbi:MAG: hypothetical protein SFU86_10580 [Pirellulaceae bacterium]|nr:hypothetical protein [Pirellulaceae bacterium]